MKSLPISETVSLRSLGLGEAWLQDQIWQNPSCLGLGELEGVTKERAVSSGGWLDLLLKNPVDDSMYEVETMLGDTNPDHIMRAIEYWDLVRRKWPQRQHFSVLVAERITKRFFNVIQILSDAVPIIAIQVNVVQSPHGQSLHFTKVLDVYEEPDDETSSNDGTYDESYWSSTRNSIVALEMAKFLLDLTADTYEGAELKFNKRYISLASSGYNQMAVYKRSGERVLIDFRPGENQDEIEALLEAHDVQYLKRRNSVRFVMSGDQVRAHADLFKEVARLNKQWWV